MMFYLSDSIVIYNIFIDVYFYYILFENIYKTVNIYL